MDLVDAPRDAADGDEAGRGRPGGVSRRGFLGSGTAALAATCALAACGSDPRRAAAPLRTTPADARLVALAEDLAEPAVAGERLDAERLRRFYTRRGFQPVWTTRQALADELVETVLNADDHGLDPEMFNASLLQRRDSFPPLRRELLLSNAFLAYADALAYGTVPIDRRPDGEALMPELVDVAAALDNALAGPDPVATIAALAPQTPAYRALREALRNERSDTAIGRAALARQRALEVNLERQRWLPRAIPADRVWVNVADQSLVLYRANEAVFTTRVVVGNDRPPNQSPEFQTKIEASFLNPPWVIPRDIVQAEILPILRRDPTYLERNDMFMRENGEVEQRPGPNAGLGLIMFDMPNRFDVYLHDTPDRHIFRLDNRRISHGCIRVQNPLEFASLLMNQPLDAIHEELSGGITTRKVLPRPVPVFVTYQTAFPDGAGEVVFRPDFYNRDTAIWRKLRGLPDEPPPVQVRRRPGPPRRRTA